MAGLGLHSYTLYHAVNFFWNFVWTVQSLNGFQCNSFQEWRIKKEKMKNLTSQLIHVRIIYNVSKKKKKKKKKSWRNNPSE